MAVKVHETGYGKWKVPVIIIAVIVFLSLAGTGILLRSEEHTSESSHRSQSRMPSSA